MHVGDRWITRDVQSITFCASLSEVQPTKEALAAPTPFISVVSCCAFSVEGLDSDPEDKSLLIDSISPERMQRSVSKLNANLSKDYI